MRASQSVPISDWDFSTVKNVLTNELYIGNQYYDKTVDHKKVPKEDWKVYRHKQQIIDRKTFDQAQQYISNKSTSYKRTNSDTRLYLLQGLLKCANCYNPLLHTEPYVWNGFPKLVRSTGKKTYYYQCSTKHSTKKQIRKIECKTIPVPAIPLENHVVDFIGKLLSNPETVFKYQQELQSKRIKIKTKEDRLSIIKDLLNNEDATKERILVMYKDGHRTKQETDSEIKELKEQHNRLIEEMDQIEDELSIFTNTDEYIKAFEVFQERYKDVIKNSKKKENRDYLYGLIHMMIKEIIVFSRPKRDTDSISGPKKEGQMIPYKLKIVLKLPSEMLKDLLVTLPDEEGKFHAELSEW